MTTLNSMYTVLLAVINSGAVVRVIYCFLRSMAQEDDHDHYNLRIKNAVYFAIIADCSLAVTKVLINYFGTGKIFMW